MLGLAPAPQRRRAGLTPMIDVVFLLLIFFMLAARFGLEDALPLSVGAGTGAYDGPPRLVTVLPDGVQVNGQPVVDAAAALAPLMQSPSDVVAVMPGAGSDVADMATVLLALRAAGITRLALVEGAR